MSEEIAVMNMNGLALATNKQTMFELSSHHPVGIMISGRSDYLYVPWEILIKLYRDQLKDKQFTTLEQYVADFLMFIDQSNFSDHPSNEAEAQLAFNALNNEVTELTSQLVQLNNEIMNQSNGTIAEYFERGEALIAERLEVLEKEYINEFTDSDFGVMIKKFTESIDDMLDNQIESTLLQASWRGKIKTLVCSNILKNFNNYSRLIFAGFGENELFPSVITVMIEGKINGKLKYGASTELSKSVNPYNQSFIIPFTKGNKVDALMTGIDDDLEEYSLTKLETMFGTMEDRLLEKLKAKFKEDVDLEAVDNMIHNELVEVYQHYNQDVFEFKQNEYIQPLTEKIKKSSKKEISEIAASYINLASDSGEHSIDTVVITKGDGFQWIKPKDLLGTK